MSSDRASSKEVKDYIVRRSGVILCYKVISSYNAVVAVNACAMVIGCALVNPYTYKCALVQWVVIIQYLFISFNDIRCALSIVRLYSRLSRKYNYIWKSPYSRSSVYIRKCCFAWAYICIYLLEMQSVRGHNITILEMRVYCCSIFL